MNNIQIVNPLDIPDWDTHILKFPEATIFHSVAWARVLIESYGFVPKYCVKVDGNRFAAILPLMEVCDFFARKKAICLPFSDFCTPLYSDNNEFHEIFEFAKLAARANHWRLLNIRGNAPFPERTPIATYYFRHVLQLNKDPDVLLQNFRNNTRRNIRKSTNKNVSVDFHTSFNAVKEFYRLNCLTRKRHGLPPQPMHFFEKLHKEIISQGQGSVAIGHKDNIVVSASVFLEFGKTAFYKYGASDDRYSDDCGNYATMWKAIHRYATRGYETFCFGKTERQHFGLLQFKNGWGAQQFVINTYLYSDKSGFFAEPEFRKTVFLGKLFKHFPIPVLEAIGRTIYKFAG